MRRPTAARSSVAWTRSCRRRQSRRRSRRCRCGAFGTTPGTTSCAVRPAGSCAVRRGRGTAGSSVPASPIAAAARGAPSACRDATGRAVVISDGYDALLRARRRRPRWTALEHRYYQRHRWRAKGIFAEAKDQHGLRRAVRRGRWNVAIQAYLTAAAINLKRLAASLPSRLFWAGCPGGSHIRKSPA